MQQHTAGRAANESQCSEDTADDDGEVLAETLQHRLVHKDLRASAL